MPDKDEADPLIRAVLLVIALAIAGFAGVSVAAGAEFLQPPPTPPPTETATPTPTNTPTNTPTPTPTNTPTPTPTNTPTATVTTPPKYPAGATPYPDWAVADYGPPWQVDCANDAIEDGYIQGSWALNFCVPGLITRDSAWYDSPTDFYGLMSSYAPGVMEAQVAHRKLPEGTRGIALMGCGQIGETAYLRAPGREWEGPFIVVDCSQQNHLYYHMVGMGLAVEIGFEQTERWGARILQRVDIHLGSGKPGSWDGVYLPYWWVENGLEWMGVAKPLPTITPATDQ